LPAIDGGFFFLAESTAGNDEHIGESVRRRSRGNSEIVVFEPLEASGTEKPVSLVEQSATAGPDR
jgi:hypothetical protein